MKTELRLDFVWIPSDLGGHHAAPYTGMRLSIRWQRHPEAYLQCARDVECTLSSYDPTTCRGRAVCSLSTEAAIPGDWLQQGELVELLNGFRVLAVGKIIRDE